MAAEHVRALGERIRLRREELGMTQDEVARQMSGTVDGQRISKWERGENRPRDESLEDLARVLKTTALALLAPEPDKTETPDPFPESQPVVGELAGVLADIKAQLVQQNVTLAEIKTEQAELRTLIAAEKKAREETETARRDLLALLAAVDTATRANLDAARRAEEARGKSAT